MTKSAPPDDDISEALRFIREWGHDTSRSDSRSTITVSAGGVGVWVATTACLIMLFSGMVGALWAAREFARYDTQIAMLQSRDNAQQAYLNAILRAAPELRKEVEKEK